MTELAESVAIGMIGSENKKKCPFSDPADGVDDVEGEDIAKDDLAAAFRTQSNDGGTLGKNMLSGSPGGAGTVGGPNPPPEFGAEPRRDTRRSGVHVRVAGTDDIDKGVYGFTVAAHHLIPGDASLAPSKLHALMTKGKSVQVIGKGGAKKNKKVSKHIGYNVNGAHNGVWLPGNYHIRSRTSPIRGKSWSDLGDNPWCRNYVAAVCKAASGQIHDAHTKYSAAVKDHLNKIAAVMVQHECGDCQGAEINPPFRLKSRLYAMSAFLRAQVTSGPMAWKRPWFASDRWRDDAFKGGKPRAEFMAAYTSASLVKRRAR